MQSGGGRVKRRLVVSEDARRDLLEVWVYVATDNQDAADRLIDTITDKFDLLEEIPEAGKKRDELATGMRSYPVQRYVIFYHLTENEIKVMRVLHSARDLSSFF